MGNKTTPALKQKPIIDCELVLPVVRTHQMKFAHFGTFDVANFGDLLFPLIARHRLSALGQPTLLSVSPVGGPPVLPDATPSIGFEEFARRHEVDGILIGGGNIIRIAPSPLAEYQVGFTPVTAYPDLWLGATALSLSEGAPICWNAPGVPEDFGDGLWPQLTTYLKNSSYVSVRDEQSKTRLLACGVDVNVSVVPDTAWEINLLWSDIDLKAAYNRAFASRGQESPTRTIAFHMNERYLFGLSASELAALLDDACRRFRACPILIAMGRCHGDHELAKRVGEQMRSAPLVVDQPASLCEIAACLAHSAAYVGSSMHGFIAAAAFDVPAICVANKSVTKFGGMIAAARLQDTILDSWPAACERLVSMDMNSHRACLRQARRGIQDKLDEHWKTILTCFRAGRKIDQTRGSMAAQPATSDFLTYRANILAQVALDQMHAARRQRAKLKEYMIAASRRRARTHRQIPEAI